MFLGKVVGTTWATQKTGNLEQRRFLQVTVLDIFEQETTAVKTVVDTLGADRGQIVLCVGGSASRRWLGTDDLSHDAAVIGIVDRIETDRAELEKIFTDSQRTTL